MNEDIKNIVSKMENISFEENENGGKLCKINDEIIGNVKIYEDEIHVQYKDEKFFVFEKRLFSDEKELEQKIKFIIVCQEEDMEDRMNEILDSLENTKLILTCGACPEQYDLFIGDEEYASGYLRLRHGFFSASYKDERVFSSNTKGDGVFDEDERDNFLFLAKISILNEHLNKENEFKYTI